MWVHSLVSCFLTAACVPSVPIYVFTDVLVVYACVGYSGEVSMILKAISIGDHISRSHGGRPRHQLVRGRVICLIILGGHSTLTKGRCFLERF